MIKSVETQGNRLICSPEVIAYNNGWLDKNILQKRAELLSKNTYGKYLENIIKKGR